MNTDTKSNCQTNGWLDSLAIGMSLLCAMHCLLTPVLIVFLPILATTFWVHENFHMWMVLFVVPTTSAAVFMGCRKHKDKAVLILSMLGMALLVSVASYEVFFHSELGLQETAHCPHCAVKGQGSIFTPSTLLNVMGGMLLASAHVRNFLLCRKSRCTHDHEPI
ncbi:MAG: MerC domain-containing protein [Verrucomicrobia bacterium]|nr:MerC domain-containing protein [Verrucomicrobiota bacterium]